MEYIPRRDLRRFLGLNPGRSSTDRDDDYFSRKLRKHGCVALDPQTLLEVAHHLLSDASSLDREASQRSGVNRLYYAHFLRLRRYVRALGVRGATNHERLGLALLGMPSTRLVGQTLIDLLRLRNISDYDDTNDLP